MPTPALRHRSNVIFLKYQTQCPQGHGFLCETPLVVLLKLVPSFNVKDAKNDVKKAFLSLKNLKIILAKYINTVYIFYICISVIISLYVSIIYTVLYIMYSMYAYYIVIYTVYLNYSVNVFLHPSFLFSMIIISIINNIRINNKTFACAVIFFKNMVFNLTNFP